MAMLTFHYMLSLGFINGVEGDGINENLVMVVLLVN